MGFKTLFSPISQGLRAVLRPAGKLSAAKQATSPVLRQSSVDSLKDHFDAHRDAAFNRATRLSLFTWGRVDRRAAIREAKQAVRAEHHALNKALIGRHKAEIGLIRARVDLKRAFSVYRQAASKAGKFGPAAIAARGEVWDANEALKKATADLRRAHARVPQGI